MWSSQHHHSLLFHWVIELSRAKDWYSPLVFCIQLNNFSSEPDGCLECFKIAIVPNYSFKYFETIY